MKDCLIIPCSDKKALKPLPAYQLYQGALMGVVNQFDINDVFKSFDVFFLSAKLGLISATAVIAPYNERMPCRLTDQKRFALEHKKNAQSLLKNLANKDSALYTVLSKDYQSVFDLMSLTSLAKFKMVYHSVNARGIGDHRSRLKRIIASKVNAPIDPVLFRSGCANLTEFHGLTASNQAIGTSLAYMSSKALFAHVIDTIKNKTNIFLDNGMISAISKGYELSEKDVFKQYMDIATGIRGTKTLAIVVPDCPFSQDKCIETVKSFKKEIKYLATKCQVIIPFHKETQRSVKEQCTLIAEILGATKFTVGIPCRKVKDNDWRLPLTDIESLFMLKDINGNQLIKKAHFLALSEKTVGTTYHERLSLAAMYNVEFSADACRTPALFGSEFSERQGSVIAREVKEEVTKYNTINSNFFKGYDSESEIDSSNLWDEIRYFTAQEKASLWNECYPHISIDDEDDDSDIEEVFDNLSNNYFHDFVTKAKTVLFAQFSMPEHEPSAFEKRTESIARCFSQDDSYRTPVQHVIGF
jgi:hypothetical protein